MSRPTWRGRPTKRALATTLRRHGRICWLCGHTLEPGTESVDHVLPASTHPDQEWNPDNWRPAHRNSAGTPRGCTVNGCRCIGNTGRKARPWNAPPSRPW